MDLFLEKSFKFIFSKDKSLDLMNVFDKKKENMSCSWGTGWYTSAVICFSFVSDNFFMCLCIVSCNGRSSMIDQDIYNEQGRD